MASAIDKRPNFRISDVEELMRETGMDNSDTGVGIVNYFRRRQADFHRGRLFDGSDNQINFRLDNLQPVQLPPSSINDAENSSDAPQEEANKVGVVLVRPLSEITMAEHRVPSFVSPGRVAVSSPPQVPPNPVSNAVSSPTVRSTVHAASQIPNRKSSANSLQRELVLQKHKRENQMKMELLRNSASQLASSTPIAGEHSQRRGENLLELRETISPIYEEAAERGTPTRGTRTVNEEHREHAMPGPSTINALAIRTPIPATQDAPDGKDRNDREYTPPRLNENSMVVVPETPSPVRKSPRIPCTPLSGLSLAQHRTHLAVPALTHHGKGRSMRGIDVGSPASSTPSRSILKNHRESRLASSKYRVSFSEQLVAFRDMTPSPDGSCMTSDEDDVPDKVERAKKSAKPVEQCTENKAENAQNSRRLFRSSRSNAIDQTDENTPIRCNNRTNGEVVNMIMDDWYETDSERMEVDNAQENPEPIPLPVAQRTINKSSAIVNIETPRTVMMDIFDPPSAFCDNEEEEENDTNVAEPAPEAIPALERSDLTRKRKQKEGDDDDNAAAAAAGNSDSDGSSRHNTDDRMPRVSPRKLSKPCLSARQSERIVSVNSPNDRVPLDMIQAVDMIHSRVNSEIMDPGDGCDAADSRRTTLNIPTKRRNTKTKVDANTELYLKAINNVCSQEKATAGQQRKDRRRLFANEISEAQSENGDGDEPQLLPPTQESVKEVEQHSEQHMQSYVMKPLEVHVRRLSLNTINRALNLDAPDAQGSGVSTQPEQAAIESSPVQEKQNEEQNEKGDRPKKTNHEQCDDAVITEQPDDAIVTKQKKGKSKSKSKPPKDNPAKYKKRSERSDVSMEKYLKNVSNQIRHQIDSEGPRRSHRNRRLAAEVLRNNPNTLQTDAPKYVMPTIADVLQYYTMSTKPKATGSKAKSKGTSSKTAANKETEERFEQPKENVPPGSVPERKARVGRPRKVAAGKQKETFDADGFRVPPLPMDDAIPGPSSSKGATTTTTGTVSERSATIDSSSRSFPQGVSIDSGLSSGVMMSDDATATASSSSNKRVKTASKKQTAVAPPEPSCSYASSTPPAPDILAEKRKTLDWMMMLMENRQHESAALPMVELQGFTHLSVEHLAFDVREGIEYSFYVYSNGDNFGFLRFPPKTEKKSTRTKRCALKFLILSGTLEFTICEVTVKAVGGDFLMIPTNSTYSIVNGSETSLMFMIKNSGNATLCETTNDGGK